MVMAPQFERERMVNGAVAVATERIGKPGHAAVDGDRVIVRAGDRQIVVRAFYSQSCDGRGIPLAGGGSWSFVAGEVERARRAPLRALLDWARRAAAKSGASGR
jgi:hypothetical protein